MAKTQPKIEDIKDLKKVTIESDGLMSKEDKEKLDGLDYGDLGDMPIATDTEVGGIKIGYIQGLDADLLDGKHASDFADVDHNHENTYTTSTDVEDLINTAVASVYKLKGNIANKAALLDLINVKQGDVYNAQAEFILSGQRVKIGDNIVCLSDATSSVEENWDNLCGNQVNRTIKVEGIDKAGSETTIPINFKSGDGVINIVGQKNNGILDIIFSSVNTLAIYGVLDPQDLRDAETGVHELIEGNLYSFTPNPICGSDVNSDSLFGKLIVLENIDGTSKTLYYHSYKTNKIHVCSGYDNGSVFVWNNWERLLTCKDNNEIPDDLEGEDYLYQINSSYQRIILNSEDIKGKTVEIDLKLFRSQIGAKLRIIIEFDAVSTSPDINIIDSSTPTKTINYSVSYYTDPYYVANVYRVEYEIFNLSTYWLVSNKIY